MGTCLLKCDLLFLLKKPNLHPTFRWKEASLCTKPLNCKQPLTAFAFLDSVAQGSPSTPLTMKSFALLFLVVICGMGGLGQKLKPKKRSNGEEINFRTKTKDVCTMSMSGDEEMKLRIECKSQGMSYWCEFTGKPSVCRPFRNNPKIYWNQIAMELRKLPHACESTQVLKATMCQKAPTEALMKQVAAGMEPEDLANQDKSVQKTSMRGAGKSPVKKIQKPPILPLVKPTQRGQGSENETEAMKLAREHCWESLHDFCSYIIGIFGG
ncbi:fibroblast growth factor-binding protein 2 isoform X1 [Phalacrocorax carbo]|uniref:fibroblast growth factor-binding protein 2 isoform X1 n=3 Tax=Phalacrocorax carbo TaxID=9209 RepID=UPI00311A5624